LVGRNANVCPPFTYKGAPKGMNSILQNRTFYFGEPPYFHLFLVMGESNQLLARKNNLNSGVTSSK
jgi:hypothetical protein